MYAICLFDVSRVSLLSGNISDCEVVKNTKMWTHCVSDINVVAVVRKKDLNNLKKKTILFSLSVLSRLFPLGAMINLPVVNGFANNPFRPVKMCIYIYFSEWFHCSPFPCSSPFSSGKRLYITLFSYVANTFKILFIYLFSYLCYDYLLLL